MHGIIGLDSLEERRKKWRIKSRKIVEKDNTARNGVVTRSAADPWGLAVPRARLVVRKHSTVRVYRQCGMDCQQIQKYKLHLFKNVLK